MAERFRFVNCQTLVTSLDVYVPAAYNLEPLPFPRTRNLVYERPHSHFRASSYRGGIHSSRLLCAKSPIACSGSRTIARVYAFLTLGPFDKFSVTGSRV
jgi:hypothetical protein